MILSVLTINFCDTICSDIGKPKMLLIKGTARRLVKTLNHIDEDKTI